MTTPTPEATTPARGVTTPAPDTPPSTLKERLRALPGWPARYLFGDDIFISYSRADGMTYAEGLAGELLDRKLNCRLDVWGTEPGKEVPRTLKRAVTRSAVLVLVGTPGAAASKHVADEVRRMRQRGRRIVPVVFDGVLLKDGLVSGGRATPGGRGTPGSEASDPPAEALWAEYIQGLPITWEPSEKLVSGEPSEEVLKRVEKTFTFKRKDDRIRLATKVVGGLLALLLLGVAGATYALNTQIKLAREMGAEAQRKTGEATAAGWLASAEQLRAERQAVEASAETLLAGEKTKLAADKTKIADEQTRRADEQTRRAETAAKRATEQERSAHRNLARSFYAQAQADASNEPLRALAWAGSALGEAPAGDENLPSYMLREVGLAARAPLGVVNTPVGASQVVVSPQGEMVLAVAQNGSFSVWDALAGAPLPHPRPDPNEDDGLRWRDPVFSQDGRRVAVVGWKPEEADGKREPRLLIWEARTGATLSDIRLEERVFGSASNQYVRSMAFSPDGQEFVVVTNDRKEMFVWDVESGRQLAHENLIQKDESRFYDDAPRISHDPARNWLLEVRRNVSAAPAAAEKSAAFKTDALRIRDIRTGRIEKELTLLDETNPAPERVIFADFTRDARKVVVTSQRRGGSTLLRAWNLDTGRGSRPAVMYELDDIKDNSTISLMRVVNDARAISPDGKSVLVLARDKGEVKGVEVWDIEGDVPKLSSFHRYDQREGIAFNIKGDRTLEPERSFYADDGEHVIDISAAPEMEQEVTVWNPRTGLLLARPLHISDRGRLLHVSARDKTASVLYTDGTVLTWGLTRDGSLGASNLGKSLPRAAAGVYVMAPAPGWGALFTARSDTGALELRDAETWDLKWRADGPVRFFELPKFSSDGTHFVEMHYAPSVSGGPEPRTFHLHRMSDGVEEPGFRPIPADSYATAEFSRDGGTLITRTRSSSGGATIKRWSAKTGEPLPGPTAELLNKDATFLDFTRFGEFCMSIPRGATKQNYSEVTLRRVDEGLTPLVRLRFTDRGSAALAAALFRAAKEIRPAGPDSVVAVLDSGVEVSATAAPAGAALTNLRTKRRLVPPADSRADLMKLVVSPDGRLVAASLIDSERALARVWDAATGLPLSDRLWHEGEVMSFAFTPDGSGLRTVTEYGALRTWFFGDFAGSVPAWAARMSEAFSGLHVAKGVDVQRLSSEEHARERREFEAELTRAAAAGDKAARFLLAGLKR